jgi:hypothetical protein
MSSQIVDYATQLLSVSGIEKVISIDDDNSSTTSPEELLGVLASVGDSALLEIGAFVGVESGDRDLIRDRIRKDWATFSGDTRKALETRLTPPKEQSAGSVALLEDLRTTSKLPEFFGDKLIAVTLAEWEQRLNEFVNDHMPPTLLLVDLSFTGEERGRDEGLRVIANLLKMHHGSNIYCGLLTSLYHMASVHEDWKRIASEHELDIERFVLIPKDSLSNDGQPFLALIKLVVMNAPANALRKAIVAAFSECLQQTEESVAKLDVFEFERIVCLTSSIEGVWEPDTLLRILSMFHKTFVRRMLRSDSSVFDYADRLRSLTALRIGEWGGPTQMEIDLRRLEWFEEAEEVNELHLPLELGDVFEIASRPNKLYVLVAQPCDLMMRQTGRRHPTVTSALLLEATHVPAIPMRADDSDYENESFHFSLDFYEAERDWRVSLRKTHYINLDVLDLCVFKSDGQAAFAASDTIPERLAEAWKARRPKLMAIMRNACRKYGDLQKAYGIKHEDAAKLALNTSLGNLIQAEIDAKKLTIKYDVKRVGRIKQPRAGALLARYANAIGRDAFEHDLIRRPKAYQGGNFSEAKGIVEESEEKTSALNL